MLSFIILFILFIGTYSGYKTGSILQLLKVIGYIISAIVSFEYYKQMSSFIELIIPYPSPHIPGVNPYNFYSEEFVFNLYQSFYDVIAVLIIFVIGWLVVQFLIKLFSYIVENIEVPEPVNGIIGAVLGYFVKYIGVFYVLFFLSLVPLSFIQNRLSDSFLAEKILVSSPMLSKRNYDYFIVDISEDVEQNKPIIDAEDPLEPIEIEKDSDEEESEED